MAVPGNERAAGSGDRGHLRASNADRESVIGSVKTAFVAGMLAKDEFDQRVDQALASRTYAELADVTADLPAGLAAQPPQPGLDGGGQPLVRPGQIITWATMLYAAAWLYAPSPAAPALAVLGGFFYLCVVAIAVAAALENWPDKQSGTQLPPGWAPNAGGSASRAPATGPAERSLPGNPGHRWAAEAERKRCARRPSPVGGYRVNGALRSRHAGGCGPRSSLAVHSRVPAQQEIAVDHRVAEGQTLCGWRATHNPAGRPGG
jgi:Domain of unknown function (DUF1707)